MSACSYLFIYLCIYRYVSLSDCSYLSFYLHRFHLFLITSSSSLFLVSRSSIFCHILAVSFTHFHFETLFILSLLSLFLSLSLSLSLSSSHSPRIHNALHCSLQSTYYIIYNIFDISILILI